MKWWTILFIAVLCSLPAVVLLWSAFHVGKARDQLAEEDEHQSQPISSKPLNPRGDLVTGNK